MNSFLKTIEKGSKSIQNFVPLVHSDKDKDKDKDTKEKDKGSKPVSLSNSSHSFPSAPSSPVLAPSSIHLLSNVYPSFSTNSITSGDTSSEESISNNNSGSNSSNRTIAVAERARSRQLCASPDMELAAENEVLSGFKCCVVTKW